MTYYRFKDGKTQKILFGLFLFVLLLLSRDTLYTSTILGFQRSQIAMFGLIGLSGVIFLAVNFKKWKSIFTDGRILAVVIVSVILLLPMVVKRDWQTMYFSMLLCLYVAIFFTYFLSYREVAWYYVLAMTFLGGYSLIACYLLKPLADNGVLSLPVVNYLDFRYFYNFGLAFPRILENYYRNFGIFREPGLYQFFLIVALYLTNYRINWKKNWQLWTVNGILAVTMVSTFSTGGVIELCLLAMVLFFEKKMYRDKRIMMVVLLGVGAGLLALVFIIVQKGALYQNLYTMVEKLFVINHSSSSRYEAIFADIVIFLQHPLFGDHFAEVLNAVEHNTASTLLLYAVFGIFGGTLNVAGWAALVWDRERSFWLNGLLVLIMLLAVNTQNLTVNVFFWLFPTMALVERTVPLLERKLMKRKD